MQIISARGDRADFPGSARATCCEATDGRFALIEHEIPPRAGGTTTCTHEDELIVLEGRVGVQIGEEERWPAQGTVVEARGDPTRSGTPATSRPAAGADLAGGASSAFEDMAPLLGMRPLCSGLGAASL